MKHNLDPPLFPVRVEAKKLLRSVEEIKLFNPLDILTELRQELLLRRIKSTQQAPKASIVAPHKHQPSCGLQNVLLNLLLDALRLGDIRRGNPVVAGTDILQVTNGLENTPGGVSLRHHIRVKPQTQDNLALKLLARRQRSNLFECRPNLAF